MTAERPAAQHHQHGEDIDGIEPDQPDTQEFRAGHAGLEAPVVGVGEDPAAQQEEEIDAR